MENTLNENILSVKEFTLKIKEKIESEEFTNVSISGEVSNCSFSQTGHFFFNLKEVNKENNEQYLLKAIIWKYVYKNINLPLKEGDKVICKGRLNLYTPSGEYRLIVESVRLSGEGEFWKKFLELKEKLDKEGLFESSRKKPIPKYPEKIGIITSETGAALQDIINTIKNRAPMIDIYLFPALVQGDNAAKMISNAIRFASIKFNKILDLIILARGGGTIEDLWPFNEEIVARAIAECKIPLITGIGHETDYTIADFVSDYRAPTPTGAAAIICNGYLNAKEYIARIDERLSNNIRKMVNYYYEIASTNKFQKRGSIILQSKLDNFKIRLDYDISHLYNFLNSEYTNSKLRLINATKLLQNLSPTTILSKGYSITRKLDGTVIKSYRDINIDDTIESIIFEGKIVSKVNDIRS